MPKDQQGNPSVNAPLGGTLGEDVRQVRQARRISQDGLASATGYSRTYVSKVESGGVIPSQRFVEGCDKAFGTGGLFARRLRHATEGEAPAWFAPYIDAEREASEIEDYSIAFIMGLLQTPAYARAVLERGLMPLPREEIEAQVTSRTRRRQIFTRPEPPRVWVVLHEASLRVQVGSSQVMAEQLAHILAELGRVPSLTVQVLPYEAASGATNTPFTALKMPEGAPVVYVEGPQGGRPYDTREAVANARRYMDHLRACALDPHDSEAYISSVKEDHERRARVDQIQLQRRHRGSVRRVGPGSPVRRGQRSSS
ncbi:helix-turn-helix domain-containing protein [Streptomyces sp. AA1529]|uniref:helix-turn-helix domain-containing protein n=1 Tax=Streptomyces sp. AA1529 TaxID=1203257 RepID=UPI0009984815